MLSIEQLEDLEERLKLELEEHLTEYLTRLNREEHLETFLSYIGLSELLKPVPLYECYKNGKILVIGESKVDESTLLAIGKTLGIDKKRFEFHLDFESGKPSTVENCNGILLTVWCLLVLCLTVALEKATVAA